MELATARRALRSASASGASAASSSLESVETLHPSSTPPSSVYTESASDSLVASSHAKATHSFMYAPFVVVACAVALAAMLIAYYKKRSSQDNSDAATSSHKDFRRYRPSPFSSERHYRMRSSSAAQTDDPANNASTFHPVSFPTMLSVGDDAMSSSYRTCSRVFTERLSSEYSWITKSDRSCQSLSQHDADDVGAARCMDASATNTVNRSEHDKQRFSRLSMAHEDSLSTCQETETRKSGVSSSIIERSTRSSQLFATFLGSERSSAVSWTLRSSWSGSEVSSLESARTTDGSLSEHSASSRRSIRATDTDFEEHEGHTLAQSEQREAAATSGARSSTIGVERQSPCDSILLFRPIKPRLLTSKLKKPATQKEVEHEDERQVFFC